MTQREAPTPTPSGGHHRRLEALRRRAEAQVEEMARAHPDDSVAAELQRLLHELSVHQMELEMQNEELVRAQAAIEAASARYFDLYDRAPVGYVTFNAESMIVEANRQAAELVGV